MLLFLPPFNYINFLFYFPAYSLDEVDKKTKAFRASANHAIQDDGTTLGVSLVI